MKKSTKKKENIKKRDQSYWTDNEVKILKENINEPYKRLKKLLPKRSLTAIIGKKDRMRLKRKSPFYWSKKEDDYLIRNYHKKPIKDLIKELNRTQDAISARRNRVIKKGVKIKDKKKFLSDYWKKQYKTNKDLIKKHQETINQLWNNPKFRERHKQAIKNMFADKKFLEKHKKEFIKRRNSLDFRKKQSKIASKNLKERHRDPEEHKKILSNLRQKPSRQQLFVVNHLRNIFGERSVGCNDWDILDGKMEVDIPIYPLKIAIEWDGEYWHTKIKNVKKKDDKKNKLLINKGWSLIRITSPSHNYLTKQKIIERINSALSAMEEIQKRRLS